MKEKIKTQKSFIQIPLLIGIIVSIITTTGIGYGAFEYHKTSKIIGEAEQLTKEEKYNEAIEKLEFAQNRWLTKSLGFRRQEINLEIEQNKKLIDDKLNYTQGIEEFNKGDWGKAKELLSKVSEISPYYQDAKNKTEEAQKKITEKQITEAVEKAIEETKRMAEEMQKRIATKETETKIKEQEAEKRIIELEKQISQLQTSPKGYQISITDVIKIQGQSVVSMMCVDYSGNTRYGSGVVIGRVTSYGGRNSTLILTNYHIIENAHWNPYANKDILKYPCVVIYLKDPAKGTGAEVFFAHIAYYLSLIPENEKRMIDFAFLVLEEKADYNFNIIPYASLILGDGLQPVICDRTEVNVGKEIIILGYPKIGGQGMVATEGIISGFDTEYYFTTSTKVEEGSSGGGAFLKSTGCLIGMPTFVRLGRIEAFARLIDIPYLNQTYLSKIFGY